MHRAPQHAATFAVHDPQLPQAVFFARVQPRGHEIGHVARRERVQIEHAVHGQGQGQGQRRGLLGIEGLVAHAPSVARGDEQASKQLCQVCSTNSALAASLTNNIKLLRKVASAASGVEPKPKQGRLDTSSAVTAPVPPRKRYV